MTVLAKSLCMALAIAPVIPAIAVAQDARLEVGAQATDMPGMKMGGMDSPED